MVTAPHAKPIIPVRRVWWLYALTMLVIGVFGVRAFYLQIIKHDYYVQAARASQLKEYSIQATRGIIKAYDGGRTVPVVLNEKRYTLFADPALIKDAQKAAVAITEVLSGKVGEYEAKLKAKDTRYVILAKKLTKEQKEKILSHKYPGIGAQEQHVRIYPNGPLAAQLLGFVNSDGDGVYGVEQALNGELEGTPGLLKAITDVHGVPLAANRENTRIPAKPGDDVVLTIDMAMQKRLETALRDGLKRARSNSGSALIMDPNTGDIKAMANWPSYDPAKFAEVKNTQVFNNAAVSAPLEVGSVMKPLTAAAALDQGVINRDTSYYDPAVWPIDGYKITNIEEDGGARQQTIQSILSLSLNTGATWLLMQMGDKDDEVTQQAREHWHSYMTKHYGFGQKTGIEQGYEAEGYVPDPKEGYGLNLAYANTAFGQAMTATPLQMAAAYSAVLNGGTYFQPRLVDKIITVDGEENIAEPKVLRRDVVSPRVSSDMRQLLEGVIASKTYITPKFDQNLYSVGGKTGTAEIAKPGGGYYDDQFNGTYVGFVGGDKPQYVIVVRVNKPRIGGYAGTTAAQPVFVDLAHMLIDDFGVIPRSR